MALTKRTFIDEVRLEPEHGNVGWRETTVIEEDGVEISRSYVRQTVGIDETRPDLPTLVSTLLPHVDTPNARAHKAAARERAKIGPRGGPPHGPPQGPQA